MKLTAIKMIPETPDPKRKVPFFVKLNGTQLRKQASCNMVVDIVAWVTGDPLWSRVTVDVPGDLVDYLKNLESAVSITGLMLRIRDLNTKIMSAALGRSGHEAFDLPDPLKKELRAISELTNTMLLMYNALLTSTYREYNVNSQNTIVCIKNTRKNRGFCRVTLKRENITLALQAIRKLTVSEFYNLLVTPIPTVIGFLYRDFDEYPHLISIKSPDNIDLSKLVSEHGITTALKIVETAIETDIPITSMEALAK